MNVITSHPTITRHPFQIGQLAFRASLLAAGLLLSLEASGYSFQPPSGYTGAPPGNNTCASCHRGDGTGSLDLALGDGLLTYEPGMTYTMDVSIQDPGQQRFGFSMVSRLTDSTSTSIGSWLAGTNSVVYDGGGHIGHSNAPFAADTYTFQVMWTAPTEDVGDITFYAVANAANGNRSNGEGDNVYTRQLTISPWAGPATFWPDSPVEDGWRNTGEGYPSLAGIGWIYDAGWPWYYTFQHSNNPDGDWIYVFTEGGSNSGFWAFNYSQSYYFYALASAGWYYSYKAGEEGWYMFQK